MVAEWVFATHNPHKLAEAQAVLGSVITLSPLPEGIPEAPEVQNSLYGNALAKASFYKSFVSAPILAEDSGLFVPALGGRPGVYSARFGGPARLLEALSSHQDRRAYFSAVLVAYLSPSAYVFFTGYWPGWIATEIRGEEGFGYDPVFIPTGESRTAAELGSEWKLKHSHRTQALRNFAAWLTGSALQEGVPPAKPSF
ncbi:MAG: RdgB/HAM1 family non-canonical purine NTP pyrophosphatase [Bacteroidia bacterium]|nr:RdgB/HAM1 family non-canonical purine NTP pyrophosphatase [Bacteroidia bacterium]